MADQHDLAGSIPEIEEKRNAPSDIRWQNVPLPKRLYFNVTVEADDDLSSRRPRTEETSFYQTQRLTAPYDLNLSGPEDGSDVIVQRRP